MKLPHKTLERKLFNSGYRYICAVDEVGMGCLAGPVVVCAVLFTEKFFKKKHKNLHWLRDSKLLAPHQREEFVRELLKEESQSPQINLKARPSSQNIESSGLKFQVGYCYPKTIDRLNIYQAARLAMKRAIRRLCDANIRIHANDTNKKVVVLVDGKTEIKNLDLPQMAIIKGDRKVFAIACASLIAKVFRDKMMERYAKKFPEYGFEKHKGYGTKFHKIKLVKFGPCKIHRWSFTPVARFVKLNSWKKKKKGIGTKEPI